MAGILRRGAEGRSVAEWQKFLNSQGFDLKVDGKFGMKTKIAIATFQKRAGLRADGVVGRDTWAARERVLRTPLPRPRPLPEMMGPAPVEPVQRGPLAAMTPQFPQQFGVQSDQPDAFSPGFGQAVDNRINQAETQMTRNQLQEAMAARQRQFLQEQLLRKVQRLNSGDDISTANSPFAEGR